MSMNQVYTNIQITNSTIHWNAAYSFPDVCRYPWFACYCFELWFGIGQFYPYPSGLLFWLLQWRHNGHDGVSSHQPHDFLLNRPYRRRSKKTSKLRVTGLCVGNSPGTGEFPAQRASNAENSSIWWRNHVMRLSCDYPSGMKATLLVIIHFCL